MEFEKKLSNGHGVTTIGVHAVHEIVLDDIDSDEIVVDGIEIRGGLPESRIVDSFTEFDVLKKGITANGNRANDKAINSNSVNSNDVNDNTAFGVVKDGINGINKSNGTTEENGYHENPSKDWNETYETIVRGPFDYQFGKPGKDFRRQLLLAFNEWLGVDDQKFEVIDKVVAMLHNASLLIDDIQDGSKLRRGDPAAHCVFGAAQAINSANYIYFLAQNQLLELENWPDAFRIFHEELINLHRGQGLELYWREEALVPHEKEYLMMVANKTGGLFRLGARLLQSVSRTNYNVVPLADVMGIAFQINDDYKNLCSDKMAAEKGYCEDLTEGKFSFPVIHALRSSQAGARELLNILRLRTDDIDLKSYAVKIMRDETKSLEYTRKTVQRYRKVAMDLVAGFDKRNITMEHLLCKLAV